MSEPSLADVVHEAVERAKADEERKPVTLIEFLLARIAEDEAVASAVTFAAAEARDFEGSGWYAIDCNSAENEAHWYRWKPERVLAECEAKRRIVAYCKPMLEWGDANRHEVRTGTAMLRMLAQPYAEHPDFDPSWRL